MGNRVWLLRNGDGDPVYLVYEGVGEHGGLAQADTPLNVEPFTPNHLRLNKRNWRAYLDWAGVWPPVWTYELLSGDESDGPKE